MYWKQTTIGENRVVRCLKSFLAILYSQLCYNFFVKMPKTRNLKIIVTNIKTPVLSHQIKLKSDQDYDLFYRMWSRWPRTDSPLPQSCNCGRPKSVKVDLTSVRFVRKCVVGSFLLAERDRRQYIRWIHVWFPPFSNHVRGHFKNVKWTYEMLGVFTNEV